jgi:hypothetical protein
MCCEQIIHQDADLYQVQFGGGVRVQHCGVIDVLAVLGQQGAVIQMRARMRTTSSWLTSGCWKAALLGESGGRGLFLVVAI